LDYQNSGSGTWSRFFFAPNFENLRERLHVYYVKIHMKTIASLVLLVIVFFACSSNDDQNTMSGSYHPITTIRYLALGDSYTIGQNVTPGSRYPEQLKDSLLSQLPAQTQLNIDIIATTGWTTTNLWDAVASQQPAAIYDLVTLLIGVNNQYQHKPFSLYEQEFPDLVNKAIDLARGLKNHVVVISIPDYAYTPFGQGNSDPGAISSEIDEYNAFAKQYCEANGIVFVDITDITRLGLENPALVASDGLHPSALAYSQFTVRILPPALLAVK
jgi:lysophospholipase L1-like esterase